jgi:hypothetical protein
MDGAGPGVAASPLQLAVSGPLGRLAQQVEDTTR